MSISVQTVNGNEFTFKDGFLVENKPALVARVNILNLDELHRLTQKIESDIETLKIDIVNINAWEPDVKIGSDN